MMFARLIGVTIFVLALGSASCRRTDQGYAEVTTKNRLNYLEALFSSPGIGSYSPDLKMREGDVMLVKDVFTDADIPKHVFLDGWQNKFYCKLSNGYIYIWSAGRNGIDERMSGDDIFSKSLPAK